MNNGLTGIITCEQVSDGHPDKICDQIADAIVTECLAHDPSSRVAIEVLIKDYCIVIAGELTSKHTPDYEEIVASVFDNLGGAKRLGYHPGSFTIEVKVSHQSPDIAQGVDIGGAGDQGMMYGYATDETPQMLPIPYVLATQFLRKLKAIDDPRLRADAKAQVSFDYDDWRVTTFLCSTQTRKLEEGEDAAIKVLVRELMQKTALEHSLNDDFEVLVNPTGKFEMGGPFADCGVTGRKLACDTYGGVGHIGGGAMSGKDPSKVDRSGAYMARKVAQDIVSAGYAHRCEVQVAYAIGKAEPVSVRVETFGTENYVVPAILDFVKGNYDFTPRGIIQSLHLLEVDYNETSTYGHFGKVTLPWEHKWER